MVDLLKSRVKGGRIADVGCGDGVLAHLLKGPGYTVHCCDFAGVHPDQAGLAHVTADLRTGLPWKTGSLQGIVCSEVLEHLLEPFRAVAELSRVLAPGGVLVLSVPNYWNLHHRFRYLLTGSLQRCYCKDVALTGVHEDVCLPHVNTATFETYSFVLRRNRLAVEQVRGANDGGVLRVIPYALLGAGVKAANVFRSKKRTGDHEEVNAWPTLLGRHVCLVCRKA
jgi:SAM-dependent methyltransferase